MSAIKNVQSSDVFQYPKYENLLEKFEIKYHQNKNRILFANGRQEAMQSLIKAYLNNGEEILAPKSSDELFDFSLLNDEYKIKYFDFDSDLNINVAYIKQKISLKTKIIYISTPDEVVGKIIRPSMLEQIIEENDDILFVLDCTYVDYSSNVEFRDYLYLIDKSDNVVIIKSYSKANALAGLRFNAIFSNEDIILNLKKVSFKNSVNSISLLGASMVLSDEKSLQEVRELNLKAKELLFDGLSKRGFNPIQSEGNFILCDFSSCCDFCYNKLKNQGVITKKFPKNSLFENYLRITIPTIGGVKFILEVLNEKEVLAFELDNVLFDVKDSYNKALCMVYSKFLNREITYDEIYETKKLNALNCDIETLKFLFDKECLNVSFNEILDSYKDYFYNPKNNNALNLIDEQEFLLSKEVLEELSKKYDLVIFSNRFRDEIEYLFKKFDIEKYFNYIVSFEDIEDLMFKPHPQGLKKLIKSCIHKKMIYFGSSADDVIAGNLANIETVGVLYNNCNHNKMMNNYRHLGATYILENIKYIEEFVLNLENEN